MNTGSTAITTCVETLSWPEAFLGVGIAVCIVTFLITVLKSLF